MKKTLLLLSILTASFLPQANSEEKYSHFPAVESTSLPQALCNLQAYNKKLADILAKPTLSTEDMVKVHELTYTIENAVNFVKASLENSSVELEKVHKASEVLDAKIIKDSGKVFLQDLTPLGTDAKCTV